MPSAHTQREGRSLAVRVVGIKARMQRQPGSMPQRRLYRTRFPADPLFKV